ncbi:hypothetical protein [Clostridium cuniculi]|uniref:hypothetical protein n=1 Tax=Clostridium cuniculi TaxID=2548455 RepID=UPI001FAD3A5C|nr:hypothetical protein [Clostridium cuniculi]
MILEIRIATFIIITILLSIIFLKKYGVGQKYSCLQLGISLISVYFAKPAGIWWGFIGLIILGIAFENEDCLNKLSENILVIFILQTCSNLIFIIDNMQSIAKGILAIIVVVVILISIIIVVLLILIYIYNYKLYIKCI